MTDRPRCAGFVWFRLFQRSRWHQWVFEDGYHMTEYGPGRLEWCVKCLKSRLNQ